MSDEAAFLLRDVLQQPGAWRGALVEVFIWEPETGLSFASFCATVDRIDFDADLGGSGGRLEIRFVEAGHLLLLYADLVIDASIGDSLIELQYRGGNVEVSLRDV